LNAPQPTQPREILVVGAGIIGACCAAYLQRDGHEVTLIERDKPAAGASWGNCAGIATGEIVPLSRPGLLPKIPKMLLDPSGPLRLRWRAAVTAAPWLLRFLAAGRDARVREISRGTCRHHRPGRLHLRLRQPCGYGG
jgi:D-amino-acid dehydrogenase